MLNLTKDKVAIKQVASGSQFTLPNGDVVSPAYEGWKSGVYALVQAPIVPPKPPLPPTKEEQEALRHAAYTAEADPLFFKWQAGEGTEAEWLAKREEIRNRYPYPSE